MIEWRDFFYFSKGERRAFILLLLLITVGGICLVISDTNRGNIAAETQPRYIVHPENAPVPIQVDTARQAGASPASSGKPYRKREPHPAGFTRTEKFPAGSIVELNTADTATLKKVPGIGSVFAGRIVKYRTLLGGFYSVAQLREVYGIDEERYLALHGWFHADTSFIAKLPVNLLPSDSLAKHPYISYKQARILRQLSRRQGGIEGWDSLRLAEEFTDADRERLSAYLSFR
jgi:hypothetical protein